MRKPELDAQPLQSMGEHLQTSMDAWVDNNNNIVVHCHVTTRFYTKNRHTLNVVVEIFKLKSNMIEICINKFFSDKSDGPLVLGHR